MPEKENISQIQIIHSDTERDRHLAAFDEDQKKIIKLMAQMFVRSVLTATEK